MTVPTRKEWQKARDAAGGSPGLVKGVKIGDLLEAYHKTASKYAMGLPQMFATTRERHMLSVALKKYRAAIPAAKTDLIKLVEGMQKQLDDATKFGERMAVPVSAVVSDLKATVTEAKKIAASGDADAYGKMWSEQVRGVGTGLSKLTKHEPGLKALLDAWMPLTGDAWAHNGDKVAGKAKTPAETTTRTKAAAGHIAMAATTVLNEFRKRHLTA